ncbi:unnamed protein product [Ambrosiozyma monospora]|uniref:Unnamed protein product n=1 Tax=Ambrosiozyma monospora TaxID=43982 RepID=A0ACB5U2H6_AMBMO|nr:unnamed protein product [Ambrosiozyma monospora]
MALGDDSVLDPLCSIKDWAKLCLGTLFIKSSYPGRASHVCTGNFLVNAGIRGKGIGTTLVECFLTWAPRLGYSYSMIELIFETNLSAKKVLEKLDFSKIGRVKSCGLLKSTKDVLIDSLTYGKPLDITEGESVTKFEMIREYLATGQYPLSAGRTDKARLRSLSYNYHLSDGKLFLKDKEVIDKPSQQYMIAKSVHRQNHAGINKVTSMLAEKYHWYKIKDTVRYVVKNCPECANPSKTSAKRSQVSKPKIIQRSPVLNNEQQRQLEQRVLQPQHHHQHHQQTNIPSPGLPSGYNIPNTSADFISTPTAVTSLLKWLKIQDAQTVT